MSVEGSVIFSVTWLYSMITERILVLAIYRAIKWTLLLWDTCDQGPHCNTISPIMHLSLCLYACMEIDKCKNRGFVLAPLMGELIFINAIADTQVFLCLMSMTFVLKVINCFLRILVLKSCNEFLSPVYFSE